MLSIAARGSLFLFLQLLIKFIHNETNVRRVNFMFDFLEACISNGFLPPKYEPGQNLLV